jgi:hypothetical protein
VPDNSNVVVSGPFIVPVQDKKRREGDADFDVDDDDDQK